MPERPPSRHIPEDVLRELRKEVGFACPVPGCGNPYLTWHHFDPPWAKEKHHRPEGLIALCLEHASQADAGAFTTGQLRALKRQGGRTRPVLGKFNWMRQKLLAAVGGNFYLDQQVVFAINRMPAIFFNKDPDGHLLLNFWMPSVSGLPRARMRDNMWLVPPSVEQLVCPPSGRLVRVLYPNGDRLKIEFLELGTADEATTRYPALSTSVGLLADLFPLTVVEVAERVAGSPIEFSPNATRMGSNTIRGGFFRNNRVAGIGLDVAPGSIGPRYEDVELSLGELAQDLQGGIEFAHFERVRVRGPEAIRPLGSVFERCTLPPFPLSRIRENEAPVNSIDLPFCRFVDCSFDATVKFVLSDEALESVMRAVTNSRAK